LAKIRRAGPSITIQIRRRRAITTTETIPQVISLLGDRTQAG
jgi:hypothetical protein